MLSPSPAPYTRRMPGNLFHAEASVGPMLVDKLVVVHKMGVGVVISAPSHHIIGS